MTRLQCTHMQQGSTQAAAWRASMLIRRSSVRYECYCVIRAAKVLIVVGVGANKDMKPPLMQTQAGPSSGNRCPPACCRRVSSNGDVGGADVPRRAELDAVLAKLST